MPQDLTTPTWYNDDAYIKDKVAECNVIRFGDKSDWTADSVKAALASAFGEETYASWMGYQNFVSNGNAENCSPSPYFVVAEYLAAKAAQLNEIKYEDKTDWDQAKVLDSFKAANISAWDHYTKYGQAEGLNPSNAFDTSEFLDAKCKVLNAWDDGAGFEGKTDWTPEDVVAVFQGLNINPIMNQPDNPDAASLVIAVPADEQVSGGNFSPWTPAPIEYNDIPLVPGEHAYTGTDGNDNFVGNLISSSSKSDLQRDDIIDGGAGQDMLSINMSAPWSGFSSKGGMTNVEIVSLTNSGSRAYSFSADGIKGAETFNVDGNVNLSDLQAGVDVNLANTNAASTSINFAKGQVDGKADALVLGLENVGTTSNHVDIKSSGIEQLTLDSTGKANFVDLSGVTNMDDLTVTGSANLTVGDVSATLETVDASAATGNIKINATASNEWIDNIALGSGDDAITVSNLARTAKVSGGEGDDTVTVMPGATRSQYSPEMNGVETLAIKGASAKVGIDGANITDLQALTLIDIQNDVQLTDYTDNSELTVNVQGTIGDPEQNIVPKVLVTDVDTINLNVGDDDNHTRDAFNGIVQLSDASTLNVSVLEGTTDGPATFVGSINAPEVNNLAISTASVNSTFCLEATQNVLAQVNDVTVFGSGAVNLGKGIGIEADDLSVNAGALYAGFTAAFSGSDADQTLEVTGSRTDMNNIVISGTYGNVTVTGSSVEDILDLSGFTPAAGTNEDDYSFDLGAGDNIVFGNKAVLAQYFENPENIIWGYSQGEVPSTITAGSDFAVNAGGKDIDLSTTTGGADAASYTVANAGAMTKLGETPEDGANIIGASGVHEVGVNFAEGEGKAVANMSAAEADATFNVQAVKPGAVANVDCGVGGIDIIKVAPATTASKENMPGITKEDGTTPVKYAYTQVNVDNFELGIDKLDTGNNPVALPGGYGANHNLINQDQVYKMLYRAGYDVVKSSIKGIISDTAGNPDNFLACTYTDSVTGETNTAVVQATAQPSFTPGEVPNPSPNTACVVVLLGVDATNMTADALFA